MVALKSLEPSWKNVVQMQKVDDDGKNTDVNLTCPDGFVPAHACILQSLSTFFAAMFASQGEYYPAVRNVLLPEYKISDVRKVVQLIYCGSVNVENDAEADVLKEILKTWKIIQKDNEMDTGPKNQKSNQILYYLFSDEIKNEDLRDTNPEAKTDVEDSADSDIPTEDETANDSAVQQPEPEVAGADHAEPSIQESPPIKPGKSLSRTENARTRAKVQTQRKRNCDTDEEESASESSEHSENDEGWSSTSSESEAEMEQPRRSLRSRATTSSTAITPSLRSTSTRTRSSLKADANAPVIIINSDNDEETDPLLMSSTNTDSEDESPRTRGKKRLVKRKSTTRSNFSDEQKGRPSASPPAKVTKQASPESSSESESGSDSEKQSLYKNPRLFADAARVCGKCKKTYSTPKEASDCITEKHKLVRCYFCFEFCANTEKLFVHYADKHKKAGREYTLLCPMCQQAVPYKSVSTHVISNHIFSDGGKAQKVGQGESSKKPTVGKPTSSVSPLPQNRHCPKRMKATLNQGPTTAKSSGNQRESDSEEEESDDNSMVNKSNMLIKKRNANGKMKTFFVEKDA